MPETLKEPVRTNEVSLDLENWKISPLQIANAIFPLHFSWNKNANNIWWRLGSDHSYKRCNVQKSYSENKTAINAIFDFNINYYLELHIQP